MYCECFTLGRFCDSSCNCIDCGNTPDNTEKIKTARKAIRLRNSMAFKAKIDSNNKIVK